MTDNQTSSGETPQPAAWRVAVATSGGPVGVGRGSIVLESSGTVLVNGPTRPGRPGGSREARLSAVEMQRVTAAVLGCRPAGWSSSRLKPAALDAFAYVLELRRGVEIHKALWHDNTRGDLPADLAELYASLETTWHRVNGNRD